MDRLVEAVNKPLQVKSSKRLRGPFTIIGVFNQNGRRYPEDVYLEAYQDIVPKIKDRRLLGELDHPQDYDEVRLSNVSHVITECDIKEMSGKKVVYGTVELLDTPAGRIAQALVKAGVPLGISSRAIGNTKRVSEGVDVTQLKLITYDLVAEPSFSPAILSEDRRSELEESLSLIESKLPLCESNGESSDIRNKIYKIRESLCTPKTSEGTEVHIDKCLDTQTLEIEALKNILESKKSVISEDTRRLKESRKEIKSLREQFSDLSKRYQSLQENHQKLQDSYNSSKKSQKLTENRKIASLTEEVVELRKRLAVEQRGMSYEQVQSLLEGVSTTEEISSKLDTLSNMKRRSAVVENFKEVPESFEIMPKKGKLSSIISKV